jgi:hypothetical protein
MHPRFTTQASCASVRTTISCALRPEGNFNSTTSVHGGRDAGARFWKKNSPPAPSTKRLSAMGRLVPALAIGASATPALAMRAPGGPGNGMPPPGDCTPQQLATLQAAVDLCCHSTLSCKSFPQRGANCGDLSQLTEKWRLCGIARTAVNTTCFRGGNDGHQIAEDIAYANWATCLCRMGQNGCQ